MPADSSDEFASLHSAVARLSGLPRESWLALRSLIHRRPVRAGEHLLRAGERATNALFIKSGLLREYYVDDAGREFTRRFCEAHDFSGSLADLIVARGALVSIEALETGEVWELPWCDIDALAERDPAIVALLRRIAERLYARKTEREYEMLVLPAARRYERFVAAQPALSQRVPRHLIASYLGITAVHLSRIASTARSKRARAAPTGKK